MADSVNQPSTADQKLQELIDATTELTESVTVSKATLDAAVASAGEDAAAAASGAEVATTQASAANTSAGKAKTEADRAKKEADNAAAVVTGGTAELEPAPGKIPIADANGHINAGWTPLLTAMYPYSGVIGSVDKGDLFAFKTDAAGDANKFTVKKCQFNINGKFVDKPQEVITLPEAEDTAARAIAFDDIFIDWNGTVTSHRSITPHRTATGYDRDAIATEHGYSKVQKGLYKVGSTYSLLLGRVARRNKGAYHPVFNPEGARWVVSAIRGGVSSWSLPTAVPHTSIDTCFNIMTNSSGVIGDPGAYQYSGYIDNVAGDRSGRSNGELYDAIYSDDFTPLYYSAKNVIDRQALLFDSFNKAVAGETFSGAEGTIKTSVEAVNTSMDSGDLVLYFSSQVYHYNNPDFDFTGELITCTSGKHKGKTFEIASSGRYTADDNDYFQLGVRLSNNPTLTGAVAPDDPSKYAEYLGSDFFIHGDFQERRDGYDSYPSARPQFLAVDIIGSLTAMPDEWKTEGIPGNWLAVDEEGEDLIPDGTAKNYKMSRKCLEAYQVLKTTDKGATWTDVTSTYKTAIESAANSMGSQSFAATDVFMVFYKTSANPFELTATLAIQAKADVFSSHNNDTRFGVLLGSHLIGKVTTGDTSMYAQSTPMTNDSYYKSGSVNTMLNRYASPFEHLPFKLNTTPNSPCFKVFPVLDVYGSKSTYSLGLIAKEVKYKSGASGDNNKFDDAIAAGNGTVTDLNGDDVIVGQKRVELPYYFSGETY